MSTAPEPMPFGRYILHQLLAEGGMAEIFLAEQQAARGVRKLVAIKRTLPHLTSKPEFVTMFLDEARLATRLSHPNVVQIFDFGEVDGRYYIAMEYLPGETVSSVIRQAKHTGVPLPVDVALQIVMGACDGLHYAHELADRGRPLHLVHRDISPSNIMVTYQGGVKVLDFGIARAADRQQEHTETGVVKGKYPYCSPEQLKSRDIDRRTDIFALGIVLYEMLTGERLFRRDTEVNTLLAVLNEVPPPISTHRPDVPAGLDDVLAQALAKNANARFSTMLEFRKALQALQTGSSRRLDEYMVQLFGERHILERLDVESSVSRAPTGISTTEETYDAASNPVSPQGTAASQGPIRRRTDEIPTAASPAPRRLTGPELPALDVAHQAPPSDPPVSVSSGTPAAPAPSAPSPAGARSPSGASGGAPLRRKRSPSQMGGGAAAVLSACAAIAWIALRPATPVAPPIAPPVAVREVPADASVPMKAAARMEIDTLPRGATIDVGGRVASGVTPLTVNDLAPGDTVVTATLEGHRPATQIVRLEAGQVRSVVLSLKVLPARVDVDAPAAARLYVGEDDLGTKRALELEPGVHRLRVELAGHTAWRSELVLKPGETRKVTAKLVAQKRAAPGKLDVSCVPWCRVFVDGTDVGKPSPIVGMSIPAGTHRLKLEHPPSGRSREVDIVVKTGVTVRESANFR